VNLSDIELPSDRKFGFFFTAIFLVIGIGFYIGSGSLTAYSFAAVGLLFLVVTLVKADLLHPLNKLWMRFGLLLGMIVSPVVLGVIFFGLFAPISLAMRLAGRDELRLRFEQKTSHWIFRESSQTQSDAFKHQF